jgi:GNAT superfamily N-acetyltransferase
MDATAILAQPGSYALLTDGSYVRIRPAVPDDWQTVHDFAETLGQESLYRRFFGFPKYPGKIVANSVCTPAAPASPARNGALLALVGERMVGLADWHATGTPGEAEIAFAVSDALHGRGVATLLAEHLLDVARRAGMSRFTAVTQSDNQAMLDVFTCLGVPAKFTWDDGTWMLSVDLELGADDKELLRDAEALRERIADDASLRLILEPRGIAVIGDPLNPATRVAQANAAAFGSVVAVAGPDGSDLPPDGPIDLAVVTSPPASAVAAARACAERGVRGLIVTATGFDGGAGRELLAICRTAGMRLVGPGSLGIANPAGGNALNVTLSDRPIVPGGAGVAVQSGGVGLALLSHLDRLGIGVRSFAGVGEKYDVSANDLLMHWEQDPETRLVLLHVESFGNPRKFARTARRLSRRVPLFAVDPEQSPGLARTALYAQAGIATVPSLGALVAVAALAAHQPEPRGPRVAVLGNTHGMVVLASAACREAGLDVVAETNIAPDADAGRLHRAMRSAAAGESCDTLLVALAPTAPQTPVDGLGHDAVPHDIPLLAVLVGQPEAVAVQQDASGRRIPCYNDAMAAAAALRAAVTATRIRACPRAASAEVSGVDRHAAHAVIAQCLATVPRGRGLYASEQSDLLAAYGIRSMPGDPEARRTAHEAIVTAWQDPVFGPLLTCERRGDSAVPAVILAPAGGSDPADAAARVLGADAAGAGDLAGLLARVAALMDDFPHVASARLTVWIAEDGAVRAEANQMSIVRGARLDPYLRRLRRAPIE